MTNLSESLKALAQEKSGYSQELRAANVRLPLSDVQIKLFRTKLTA